MEPKSPVGGDHVCDGEGKKSVDYDAGSFGGEHPQVAHYYSNFRHAGCWYVEGYRGRCPLRSW